MTRPLAWVLLLLAVAAPTPAWAGPPNPLNCHVPPRLVSCPAGDSTFVVIVRGWTDDPWTDGCCVRIDLCTCAGYHLSRLGTHPYTVDSTGCGVSVDHEDALGEASFPLAGGGLCPGDSVLVTAEGIPLFPQPRVVSLDQDGNLVVDATDVAIVQAKVGTADPTADFDGDGQVTAADVAIVQAHLGHHAPDVTAVGPDGPGRLALSPPWPNPFAGSTRFALTLDRDARVVLSVCDVSGRRVAVLFDGAAGAGPHAFAWNGRAADGSVVPSGAYFVEARVDGVPLARRTIFLGGR